MTVRDVEFRVLLIWHGAAGGAYGRRLEALAQQGIHLDVITPSIWWENAQLLRTEPVHTPWYRLHPVPAIYPRHGSLHLYRYNLRTLMRALQPDVVHVHEEPFSLVTGQVAWAVRRYRPSAALVVESWQNLFKRFPPPFSWIERWVIRNVDHLIAGSDEIREVLIRKGATVPISVIPLATDTVKFRRTEDEELRRRLVGEGKFVIGYVGRLVSQKGVDVLIDAVAGLDGPWFLLIVGTGPEGNSLRMRCQERRILDRVRFLGHVPHAELPRVLSVLDVLVLPSVTMPHSKEQFGRVLIEAMACEVPVVGSSSGEIPNVIGDAGLIFPEGRADLLRGCLERLRSSVDLRVELARKGLARVQERYTWEKVATETVAVYRRAVARRRGPGREDA